MITTLLTGLVFAFLSAPVAERSMTELVPPREIRIVVLESGGKPLPGATVSLFAADDKSSSDARFLIQAGRLKITGQDGRATFGSLLAGDYYIRVEMQNALPLRIGPVPIGKKCIRIPELRVVVPFWAYTCY